MSNTVGTGIARTLIDSDGDNITDASSNALKVKLVGSDTINANIGDIDLEFNGTAASVGNGTADTGTLRVTIASDSTGYLRIADGGGSITVDGTVTAELSSTDNAVLDSIASSLSVLDDWDDSNYANVNINLAGSDAPTGGGAESGALRVTIANDSTGVLSIDDNGGSITIDGTVTAELSSTDKTVLDNILTKNTEIDAVLDTIKVDTEAIETAVEAIQVDAAAIEVLLTAANVDHAANEALLTTIDADTGAIKTAVEIIDNAISGNEMQVDIVASLPAGSNAIGKLAANSGVDIGDVDVTSTVHPAGNGTFNSYAQFDAATSPTALTDSTNGVNDTETAAKEVIIQADYDNSGYIMVGDSGAAADTNGIRLNAGDTLILPIANIANIYIDGSASSQKVNVTVIK